MKSVSGHLLQKFFSLSYAILALILVSSMLIWPRETYDGARFGLEIWGSVLVPSLLPFFIVVDIIINLGIVKMLGVLLEPVMRPLFNLPGSASFAIVMGFTSGFPMGAVVTRRLHEERLCQIPEAERLVAFTNNSSPLFILVAVAVGVFSNPALGLVMMIAHYLANIFLGIILGLLAPRRKTVFPYTYSNIISASIRTLIEAQKDRKPLGKLFSDAIHSGIKTILLIGGFVIIYAVVIKILYASGLMNHIRNIFAFFLKLLNADISLSQAFSVGFFEITLGLKTLSQLNLSYVKQAVAASMLLGWSGLCIQSQVLSVLAGSGIKAHLYIWGRVVQSIISGILAFFLAQTTDLWSQYFILPAAGFLFSSTKLAPYSSLSLGFILVNIELAALAMLFMIAAVLTGKIFSRLIRYLRKRQIQK